MTGVQRTHVDGVTLDRRSAVGEGELDSSAQQRGRDTTPTRARRDGEARHPPSVRIWTQQTSQRAVSANSSETFTRADASPPHRLVLVVRKQTRRDTGRDHLAVQGGTIVASVAREFPLLRWRFKQAPAPAPGRIAAAPPEHDRDVTPPARCQRADLRIGHGIEPSANNDSRTSCPVAAVARSAARS